MYYLYRTIAKKEAFVKKQLEDRGFTSYLPTIDNKPLFPTYIFVGADNANLYELNRINGSLGIVTFGQQQATVPDSLIDTFRDTDWNSTDKFTTGAKIRITSGPFNYREAIVKAKKGDRIIVLLNMLNQEQEINLSIKEVEAA